MSLMPCIPPHNPDTLLIVKSKVPSYTSCIGHSLMKTCHQLKTIIVRLEMTLPRNFTLLVG
jgi:hypothetical protein